MGVSALTRQLLAHKPIHRGAWTLTRMSSGPWLISDKQALARGDPVCSTRHGQNEDFLILLCPQGLSGQGGLTPTPKKASKDQKEREYMGPSNHHFLPDTSVKYYSQTGNTAILRTFKGNACC